MRKNCFSNKIIFCPPPPQICFLKMFRNSIKRETKIYKYFFQKLIQNSNNIQSISKTIQHTPMTWCTYLQRKYCNAFSSYRAKTKRDRRTGGVSISPVPGPGPPARREIKNIWLLFAIPPSRPPLMQHCFLRT